MYFPDITRVPCDAAPVPSFWKPNSSLLHAAKILPFIGNFGSKPVDSGNDGRIHAPLLRAHTRIGVNKRGSDKLFAACWSAALRLLPPLGAIPQRLTVATITEQIDSRGQAVLS